MARILLVEDHARFAGLLREHLRGAGHAIDVAGTVSEFKEMSSLYEYALYIIDLGLPDGDGIKIIADLRAAKRKTPILVETARATIKDLVAGLDCGADDYLIKPFNHAEFVARVRALLRRPTNLAPENLLAGKLVLECKTGEVTCEGRRIELRASEQRLLSLLIERTGHLVSKTTIENTLQSAGHETTPNAVEQRVSRLRKALHNEPTGIQIRTVRGVGYVLEACNGGAT